MIRRHIKSFRAYETHLALQNRLQVDELGGEPLVLGAVLTQLAGNGPLPPPHLVQLPLQLRQRR